MPPSPKRHCLFAIITDNTYHRPHRQRREQRKPPGVTAQRLDTAASVADILFTTIMDEKKHSRLEVFEALFKEFYKLAMSMDAVRCFKKECQEMDEVILQNPVNYLGHLHLKPEEVMPFIDAEMQKKQERARQLADSIKSLLDEGNYEQWNLLEDGLTVADFIDKGIPATFDREQDGLTEQYDIRKALQRADVKDLLRDLSFRGFERVIDATGKEYNLMEYMEVE